MSKSPPNDVEISYHGVITTLPYGRSKIFVVKETNGDSFIDEALREFEGLEVTVSVYISVLSHETTEKDKKKEQIKNGRSNTKN